MVRRVFVRAVLGMLCGLVMTSVLGMASESQAAGIRYFVIQSSGLFEVTDRATGGRFTPNVTGERIQVPGRGLLPVVGQTDRASRGESVVNQVTGSGVATIWVTRTSGGRTSTIVPAFQAGLPIVVSTLVSANANDDNITGYVRQNGATISHRLPIGTRP